MASEALGLLSGEGGEAADSGGVTLSATPRSAAAGFTGAGRESNFRSADYLFTHIPQL